VIETTHRSNAIAVVSRVKKLQQGSAKARWNLAGVAAAFVATALVGATAHAMVSAPVLTSTPKAYDAVLQDAFECRGVAPNIDLALQMRQIATDGVTHTTLTPPITVLGFKAEDVTVFRDSGEDVYTVYIKSQGAAVAATLKKKAKWPGAAGFSVSSLSGGVTRLACSISPSPGAGGDDTD
jgi:hypothetical protein